MKIEIYSDFVCPFCYIGETRLFKALELANCKDVKVEFKAFELDPNAKLYYSENLDQLIAKKYGLNLEDAVINNRRLTQSAREEGLVYNLDSAKHTNTFDAHRLSFLFKEYNLSKEYTEAIMKAYFTDSKLISNHSELLNILKNFSISEKEILEVLQSDRYSKEVRENESEAVSKGIRGVPYFIIDGNRTISGAQPLEVFLNTLKSIKN